MNYRLRFSARLFSRSLFIPILSTAILLTSCEEEKNSVNLPAPQPILSSDSTQVLVPAGFAVLGNAPDGWGNYTLQSGADTAWVDSFYIDRYEVSNQQYADYLSAALDSGLVILDSAGVFDALSGSLLLQTSSLECRISYDEDSLKFMAETGYEDWPVVEVSWFGAQAFTEFYGKRLPTEVEWEKAARGTVNVFGVIDGVGVGYPYPWGDSEPDDQLANFGNAFGAPEDVQSYPEGMSWFGAFNLAGNVWEWTATVEGSSRVRRGGSYISPSERLKTGTQYFSDPATTDRAIGFRCAADP